MNAYVVIRNPDFSNPQRINDLSAFQCARKANEAGECEFSYPSHYGWQWFTRDAVIELYRVRGSRSVLSGRTIWLANSISLAGRTVTIKSSDCLNLLERRVVAWYSVQDQDLAQNYYSIKMGPAADIIRSLARENFGSLVVPANPADIPSSAATYTAMRQFQGVAIEEDDGLGPSIKVEFAWKVLSEAMNDVVQAAKAEDGTKLYYDFTVQSDGDPQRMTFHVWKDRRGADRTREITFSRANGLLDNDFTATLDYAKDATWMHVLGDGEASLRMTLPVFDQERFVLSPYYPIEATTDVDSSDQALMESAGKKEMALRKPKWIISAKSKPSDNSMFEFAYSYGDEVSVDINVKGIAPFNCAIDRYSINYEGGREVVETPFTNEVDE